MNHCTHVKAPLVYWSSLIDGRLPNRIKIFYSSLCVCVFTVKDGKFMRHFHYFSVRLRVVWQLNTDFRVKMWRLVSLFCASYLLPVCLFPYMTSSSPLVLQSIYCHLAVSEINFSSYEQNYRHAEGASLSNANMSMHADLLTTICCS